MKVMNSQNTVSLIEHTEWPCVSIYFPTHVPGSDVRGDSIRLKNCLQEAQHRLEGDLSSAQRADLLAPGYELLKQDAFWKEPGHGIGLFLSPSFSDHFKLDSEPDEGLSIGHSFHVLPLLDVLNEQHYYILLLDQKEIRLFEASRRDIREVPLPDLPHTLDAFLRFDVTQEHIQVHTTPIGKSIGTDAVFHGQGNIADDARHKQNVEQFMIHIAKGIDKQLYGKNVPLVPAGVDFVQSLFRRHCTYRHLHDEGISCELGKTDAKELHRRAEHTLSPVFEKEKDDALAAYENQINTPLTSAAIETILPAAFDGRVDTLLVAPEKPVFGTFDPQNRSVACHRTPEAGDEDLVNLAVIYTLRHDGTVRAVAPDRMPEGGSAAVFRYEA